MNKIYLFATPAMVAGDVIGHALCDDGECIASHWSSGISFAQHDMGLTSDWKHDIYEKKYPDGYELEWIDRRQLDTHAGFQEAYRLNQLQKLDTNHEASIQNH